MPFSGLCRKSFSFADAVEIGRYRGRKTPDLGGSLIQNRYLSGELVAYFVSFSGVSWQTLLRRAPSGVSKVMKPGYPFATVRGWGSKRPPAPHLNHRGNP